MFICNPIYEPILHAGPQVRYVDIWGGRGRGGSHFGTTYFLAKLMNPGYFRGYIMRSIFGDIRESLWRDIKDRCDEYEIDMNRFHINETMMTIADLKTGNAILSKGFKKSSGSQTAKLKSIAGATHILIEEAEEVEEYDFMQLDDSLRTTKASIQIIRLFNPPKKNHHLIKNWYNLTDAKVPGYFVATPKKRPDFISVFGTYEDNYQNLSPTTVENFERYKGSNSDYYWTVVRGLVSEGAKGRIYKDWKPITNDEFKTLPYPSYYGLDFGYSEDPLALIEIKAHNNKRWVRELLYQSGLTNSALVERIKALDVKGVVYADSAEPKSIQEIRNNGINIQPALKGTDSILFGINHIQGLEVYYTESSKNLEHEYQEYRWQLDPDKSVTDRPVDKFNHLHDAFRYAESTKYMRPSAPLKSVGKIPGRL